MPEELEALRSKFIKTYASLPQNLRDSIIAIVDERPFSWDSAYFEISGKKPLGDQILRRLAEIKVL